MLMTALANNNGYCVLLSALCQKSWQDCLLNASIATSNKNSNLQKSQSVNCIGAIDTCQLLMLTKMCQLLSQILMFAHKSVTNVSKAIDTSPYSMHNAVQTQCSFENMPFELFN